MKNGTYTVSFDVVLTNCDDEDEAKHSVMEMVNDMLETKSFPDFDLEFVKETDYEYEVEENELEELNFG
jgi:hypothetical protein